ncbi:MAG TPA: class I SAM-dependent methyltransferase [Actinomycetota bacterium]|jgi:predicted O-methyltransferase YrrM|nr:class I SAM-dependent methyltransferase [Actinomycetota bacterium]
MVQPVRNLLSRLYRAVRPIPSGRIFDYDRRLLVNPYLAEREHDVHDLQAAMASTGLSLGYPAWNLLYYALLCSLPPADPVVVETGTNQGFSTIVLAQALIDAGAEGLVRTVDIDPEAVALARRHAQQAKVAERIRFEVADSRDFLARLAAEVDHVDFAFLDGDHRPEAVVAEFEQLRPLVAACRGKVYFDNTATGGVAEALRHIHATYGGNLVEFPTCSWAPPGNAIWQPARPIAAGLQTHLDGRR